MNAEHGSSTACVTETTSTTHSSASIGSGLRRWMVQDGRAHVQGHLWDCAVISESTGSCRRSAWLAFHPLCSDQSSAGAARKAVYRRRPGFPVARPTIWNSLPDNVISAPSLSTSRQRPKTFLFQASFPDIIIDPR